MAQITRLGGSLAEMAGLDLRGGVFNRSEGTSRQMPRPTPCGFAAPTATVKCCLADSVRLEARR